MNVEHEPREASPRAIEGALAPTVRGRSTAPHFLVWIPILAKVGAAAVGAVILAVIGAKAGAHGPPPAFAPASSAGPAVLAAALVAGAPLGAPLAPAMADPAPAATDAGAAEPPPAVPAPSPGGGLLADGRVVLNAATEADLTKLPGIGPSRARAILALRQRLTRFRAVEDLLRVKGIGRKMLRRLRPSVVLDRPADTTAGAPPSTAVASPAGEHSDTADR